MTEQHETRRTPAGLAIHARHTMAVVGENEATAAWDAAYAKGSPPWDIGRPQSAFIQLADAGEIKSPVLDSGCGTGEHALLLASRGLDVLGIDLSPTAIAHAKQKATERGLTCEFLVGDVLALGRLGRRFRAVIDSGVFHTFDDRDRARYVESLAAVVENGGVLHLLAFSELTPGTEGPRRVTQAELRAAFADGWEVKRIDAAQFDVRTDWTRVPPRAWLATIVRRAGAQLST